MANLSRPFPLKCTRQLLLLTCLWLGLSVAGFSQVTYENAFPSLTFEFPVEIQNTGISGDDRLFVVGQRGDIRVFTNDASAGATSTFLDIQSEVFFNVGQELGLLGLAFHPDYETNGFFYVYYTRSAAGTPEIVVERFRVDSGNPNQANKSSRQVIFSVVKNQSNSNHNGGKIAFGPDGYLYISIGDGGGGGDPRKNGQNVNTYFGSILRLDVDLNGNNPVDANGLAPEGRYEVPANNPLVGQEGLDEIYAWGIRNTWKMSFDPPTGRLWGGDVGQNAFEEINLIVPGNFGWSRFEGVSVYDSSVPDPGNAIPPAFYYSRSSGDRSVTGGYVYRGSQVSSTAPSIAGKYLFADYVSGRVWALDYNATTQEATRELLFRASSSSGSSINVSTFGLDINGEMYFAGYGSSGSIYKLKDGTTGENAVAVNGVGSWNDDLGNIQGEVNAIVTMPDQTVYVGGNFSEVGSGIAANNVARWTPASGWENLGSGTNGVVNALALDASGALYVGGSFTTAGSTAARNVAKYTNGQNWEALAGGVSGAVLALTTAGNTLYTGGAFVAAGGTTVNNIAAWNGSWSALRDSNTQQAGTNNEIRSMAVDEAGTLYVGGNFGSAGGNSASRIARWNGSRWSALGEGTSGFVQSIVITDQYLYAGGNFTIAGNQTVNRIARWDRSASTWSALSNGLSNSVNAMVADENFLYVGGQFRNALNTGQDNIIVNNVVRWSDAGWEALGEGTDVGVDNYVNVLSLQRATLYAGGRFETAGNQTTRNLATWSAPATPPTPSASFEAGKITIQQPNRTTWVTVNLTQTFTQPVVVVSPPTYNGSQPTTVRVRNVGSSSFEVQIDEWEYLDGWHVSEELNYLVVEAGNSTLAGLAVEAGRLSVDENFKAQSFAQSFPSSPVVLAQCASDNESSAVATRLRNVTANGFEVRLQEEEAANGAHADEELHYIALSPGTGNETDWQAEVASLGTSFTDQWRTIDFLSSPTDPLFFAAMQSYRGSDPAALRYRALDGTRAEVKVEEEQSRDSEVAHTQEAIGYLVLSDQGSSSANSAASRTSTASPASELAAPEPGLRLYPNPVRVGDELVLEGLSASLNQLTVYNAQGQVLLEAENVDQPRLGTNGWQPGLYFVRCQSAEGTHTERLLIVE